MREMQLVAAFCSHQAWSVRMSSSEIAARSTQRGSVGSWRPKMFFGAGAVSMGRNYAYFPGNFHYAGRGFLKQEIEGARDAGCIAAVAAAGREGGPVFERLPGSRPKRLAGARGADDRCAW